MKTLGILLYLLSGWILLAVLAIAPWALGSLPPTAITLLLETLAGAACAWGVSLYLQRKRPPLNWLSLIGLLLLLQGWIMALSPRSSYDTVQLAFHPIDHLFPGSVDAASSKLAMFSFTVLFVIYHVALDHLRSPLFRKYFLWTAALTGASVALLGALQHFGITSFLLNRMSPAEGQPFGSFNYHNNAGSMLLCALPCALCLAAIAWATRRKPAIIGASLATLLIFGGIALNTSRFAQIIAALIIFFFALAIWKLLRQLNSAPNLKLWLIGVSAIVMASAGTSAYFVAYKWNTLSREFSTHGAHVLLWKIDAQMAADAGPFGYGPNTFNLLLPISPHFRSHDEILGVFIVTFHTPGTQVSIWNQGCNDLLQSIVEWGWLGGALWASLLISTLSIGISALKNRDEPASFRLLLLAPFTALAALMLHGLIDFPFQILALQLYAVCFAAYLWSMRQPWHLRRQA